MKDHSSFKTIQMLSDHSNVDYRELNKRTIRDAYALPRIDETMDHLHGSKYFSCLDLKSGYWQVEVAEEHKERTAFTLGPLGFF